MKSFKAIGLDRVIGICGQAGTGKTTAAVAIAQSLPYWRYSFAGPLKDAVSGLFRIPREDLDDPIKKYVPQGRWRNLAPRKIMQLFGTECMRDVFFDDFWTRVAEDHLEHLAAATLTKRLCVVIDDVRFPNEIEWVKNNGGRIIYLFTPRTGEVQEGKLHSSERINIPRVLGANEATVCNVQGAQGKFVNDVLRIAKRWHYENDDLELTRQQDSKK